MKKRMYYTYKRPHVNVEGKKGESLFHSFIFPGKDILTSINVGYMKYGKLIRETKDERLLAFIGALCMEEALDSFLGDYIPNYRHLEENRDFSLSMKIELVRSLRLIPMHLLGTADMVRDIRNKFAHNLDIDSFDSLDNGRRGKLRNRFKEIFPDDEISDVPLSELFEHVVGLLVSTLRVYQSCVAVAREYIYSEDFLNELNKRIEGKVKKQ